jgi:hypothetical protein
VTFAADMLTGETRRRGDGKRGRVSLSSARRGEAWASSATFLRLEDSAVGTPRPTDRGDSQTLHSISLRLCISAVIVFLGLHSFAATNGTNGTPSRNIGIEGNVSVALPRADYRPRPLDDRTELILRIESITTLTNGQHRYDFYYMGLEPGLYKLADYLIRPDGSRPDELDDVRIQVRALLPDDHDGKLNAYLPRLFPFIGGYRVMLVVLAVVWAGGIAAFIIVSRKKRPVEAPVMGPPEPSLAERLRPLVEAAAMGELSVEGQATLERMLMGYWRERVSLPDVRMAEALMRLKAHTEAGELLRALERWLHRPGGVSRDEVASLLQPYRNVPAPVARREGGTA